MLAPCPLRSGALGVPPCCNTVCKPAKRLSLLFLSFDNDGPVGGPRLGADGPTGLGSWLFGPLGGPVPMETGGGRGPRLGSLWIGGLLSATTGPVPCIAFKRSGCIPAVSATGVEGPEEVAAPCGKVDSLRGPLGVGLSCAGVPDV